MFQTSLIFILTLIPTVAIGQVKPPLAIEDYREGLNPSQEIRLFDLKEIKERKIDTAYIIYHPASWAEYDSIIHPCTCSYNDTLSRYVFDDQGRIRESTNFQGNLYYSRSHFDTSGNLLSVSYFYSDGVKSRFYTINLNTPHDSTSYKEIYIRQKINSDSLITIIALMKFKNGLDTATIETKRYNSKGKLVEKRSTVNARNAQEYDDDTNSSTYHFQYDYDDQGRLIYYRDFSSKDYEKITYPLYGMLTEIYRVESNKLINRHIKLVREEKGVMTITFDKKQIILTPLENGSKLFKLVSILESGPIPILDYREIVYKTRR